MANNFLKSIKIGRQTINFRDLLPQEQQALDADVEQNIFGYADNIMATMIRSRRQRIAEIVGNMAADLGATYMGLDAEGSELTMAALEPAHFADGTNWGVNWAQTSTAANTWETHGYTGTPAVLTTVTVRTHFAHVFFGIGDLAATGFVDAAMIRPSLNIDRRIRLAEMVALLPNNEWTPVMPIKTYVMLKGETFDFRLLPNTALANMDIAILGISIAPADRVEKEVFAGSLV